MQAILIYAGANTFYTEVNWFYPKSGSEQIDRCVTYNYAENCLDNIIIR